MHQHLHRALEAMLKAAPPSADPAPAVTMRRRVLEGDAKHALALRPGSQGTEQGPQLLPAPGQLLSEAMEAYFAAAGGTMGTTGAASGGDVESGSAAGEAALRLALLCNHLLRVCVAP